MDSNPYGASSAESNSEDDILLVGCAPLPAALWPHSSPALLSIEIRIDRRSGQVTEVASQHLSTSASALLGELLIGRRLEESWDDCVTRVRGSYLASTTEALLQAMDEVRRQHLCWRDTQHQADSPPMPSLPDAPISDPTPQVGLPLSQLDARRELGKTLAMLLARSRLHGPPGRESDAPADERARRQLLRLYAQLHQLARSLEMEGSLAAKGGEPIEVSDLVQRALHRLRTPLHLLPVVRHLPADLPAARGDAMVLEEALLLLFDDVIPFATRVGAVLEVTAQGQKSEVWLEILAHQKSRRRAIRVVDEPHVNGRAPNLQEVWANGLGMPAARALAELQGARLWLQSSPASGQQHLCLALPAYSPREQSTPDTLIS